MAGQSAEAEGYLTFKGYKVWHHVCGAPDKADRIPVLVLHGGPGASHDYLDPLGALAIAGRRVIFYDQLGGGDSDHPNNPDLWSVELFVAELAEVRKQLGLDRVHLIGHSWGGMLAMEYALTQPAGLESMVLFSTTASVPQWREEVARLRKALPPALLRALEKNEQARTTDSPEYQKAIVSFYKRHICQLDPWPACLVWTFDKVAQEPEVFMTMAGPSEFHVIGKLRDWDIRHRLGEIQVPTLVLGGRRDETTPAVTETVHKGIAGSEWMTFEESSHMAHLEEPERFFAVVADFLARGDLRRGS